MGMPQVDSNGGHQVVDMDWERRKTGADGGGLLEDLDKDCEEADSFSTVSVRWRRPNAAGHPCRQDGASTMANATGGGRVMEYTWARNWGGPRQRSGDQSSDFFGSRRVFALLWVMG
jgi:hypothetical protein